MDLKGRLRQAAGLFVEMPPEEHVSAPLPTASPEDSEIDAALARQRAAIQKMNAGQETTSGVAPASKTIEQIVRDSHGPNLGDIKVQPEVGVTPPTREDGSLDFPAIYGYAALPAAPFSAEQTLALLQSLPADLPLGVRRQTVRVSIDALGKAMGATPETIVADASRKLAALSSFADSVEQHTRQFVDAGEFEIGQMLAQIEEKRQGMAAAQARRDAVQTQCHAEADRLDEVLQFFGTDTRVSEHTSATAARQS